jgi:ABC-type multidrug transport system fused ATPase/permease subunit
LQDDLAGLPAGMATQIGELGVRVSGGQRQRIALARAMAAAGQVPGLLVLDDPFSAVDVHTEAAIVAGLRDAFGSAAAEQERATVLLFSHRLAAFPLADMVVVLDAGRVIEKGSHAELVAAGGLYARIARAQARMEALGETVGAAP